MIYISKELSEMSTRIKKELASVDLELKNLPQGRLSCERQKGKLRLVKEQYRNHQRIRRNLSPNDPEVAALIRGKLYFAQQKCLQNSIQLLEHALSGIKDFDLTGEIYELRKQIPILTEEIISDAISPAVDVVGADWANEQYEKYERKDDNTKWQMSTFGMRFRSKSELLIAEMMNKYGVKFRYEQVIHFEDETLAPDFTIKRKDGKIIYWEHEGLTSSKEYLNRQMRKHQIYAINDIVPWDNLIVTYDNADGIIDLRIVESEIKNKLL